MGIEFSIRKYLVDHGIKQSFVSEKCGWPKQKTTSIMCGKKASTSELWEYIRRLKRKVSILIVLNGVLIGCIIILFIRYNRISESLRLATEGINLVRESI